MPSVKDTFMICMCTRVVRMCVYVSVCMIRVCMQVCHCLLATLQSLHPVVVSMVATVFANVDVACLVFAYPASSLYFLYLLCVCAKQALTSAHMEQRKQM